MRGRLRPNLIYQTLRRGNLVFAADRWTEFDPDAMKPVTRDWLLSKDSRKYLEFEGEPAAPSPAPSAPAATGAPAPVLGRPPGRPPGRRPAPRAEPTPPSVRSEDEE